MFKRKRKRWFKLQFNTPLSFPLKHELCFGIPEFSIPCSSQLLARFPSPVRNRFISPSCNFPSICWVVTDKDISLFASVNTEAAWTDGDLRLVDGIVVVDVRYVSSDDDSSKFMVESIAWSISSSIAALLPYFSTSGKLKSSVWT